MSVSVLVSVSTKCFCVCLYNFGKTSFILAQVTNACWYCDISRVEYFLEFTLRQSKPTGTHISSPLLGVRSAWAWQRYCWHYVGFARMLEPAKFGSFFVGKEKRKGDLNPLSTKPTKCSSALKKLIGKGSVFLPTSIGFDVSGSLHLKLLHEASPKADFFIFDNLS